MKKFYVICVGLLIAVCASAQYVPGYSSLETKGSRVYADGVLLDKSAAASCFSNLGGADRSEDYLKYRSAYKAGLGLTIGGASAVAVGSVTSLVGLIATVVVAPAAALGGKEVPGKITGITIAGVSVMGVGVAALVAGIPTMTVYRKRIKNLSDAYNNQKGMKTDVSFGGQSCGLGLALNF